MDIKMTILGGANMITKKMIRKGFERNIISIENEYINIRIPLFKGYEIITIEF